MLKELWQSLTDTVFGSLPSFIDAGEYIKKEVRGKVQPKVSGWVNYEENKEAQKQNPQITWHDADEEPSTQNEWDFKIGRASCRERVCQYV